jgi:hypothetical protein
MKGRIETKRERWTSGECSRQTDPERAVRTGLLAVCDALSRPIGCAGSLRRLSSVTRSSNYYKEESRDYY